MEHFAKQVCEYFAEQKELQKLFRGREKFRHHLEYFTWNWKRLKKRVFCLSTCRNWPKTGTTIQSFDYFKTDNIKPKNFVKETMSKKTNQLWDGAKNEKNHVITSTSAQYIFYNNDLEFCAFIFLPLFRVAILCEKSKIHKLLYCSVSGDAIEYTFSHDCWKHSQGTIKWNFRCFLSRFFSSNEAAQFWVLSHCRLYVNKNSGERLTHI